MGREPYREPAPAPAAGAESGWRVLRGEVSKPTPAPLQALLVSGSLAISIFAIVIRGMYALAWETHLRFAAIDNFLRGAQEQASALDSIWGVCAFGVPAIPVALGFVGTIVLMAGRRFPVWIAIVWAAAALLSVPSFAYVIMLSASNGAGRPVP